MDTDRFDSLSRLLSGTPSRRVTLRALLGALIGGAVLDESAADAAKRNGKRRGGKKRDDKRGGGGKRGNGKKGRGKGHVPKPDADQTQDPAPDVPAHDEAVPAKERGDRVTTESHGCRHAGSACTTGSQCCTKLCLSNGTCSCDPAISPCPKSTPCKTITCNTRKRCVTQINVGAVCNDGLRCTVGDTCDSEGRCVGTPKHGRCPSSNPCRPGRCRPNSRNKDVNGCVFEPITGGETLTCGIGECRRTVQQCLNGQEQTCVPGQPSAEVCDGKDNDCDGAIDEDFDFENDADNCGACGVECTASNPTTCGQNGICANRTCQLYAAETECRPRSCTNGVETQQAFCDGAGNCPPKVEVSCAPGRCVNDPRLGPSCGLGCSTDDDCSADGWCDGGKVCKFKQDNGTACDPSTPQQCKSGFCTNGVCCESDCDDGIACTTDTCDGTGACVHTGDDSVCPVAGQVCDFALGCTCPTPQVACGGACVTEGGECTTSENEPGTLQCNEAGDALICVAA